MILSSSWMTAHQRHCVNLRIQQGKCTGRRRGRSRIRRASPCVARPERGTGVEEGASVNMASEQQQTTYCGDAENHGEHRLPPFDGAHCYAVGHGQWSGRGARTPNAPRLVERQKGRPTTCPLARDHATDSARPTRRRSFTKATCRGSRRTKLTVRIGSTNGSGASWRAYERPSRELKSL